MLPRAARLRHRRDFDAVYRTRRSWALPGLALHVRMTPAAPARASGATACRIGFVISKKTARRAHDRNRLKRRLREAARAALLPRLVRPADLLFVARASAVGCTLEGLTADVETLARQAGLMKP